jgi:hypothetical protein
MKNHMNRVMSAHPASCDDWQNRMREADMERTDWIDEGLDATDARLLMVTAITHHRVSSPNWGVHEVRKLCAELAEIDALAIRALVDHCTGRPGHRRLWGLALRTRLRPLAFSRAQLKVSGGGAHPCDERQQG